MKGNIYRYKLYDIDSEPVYDSAQRFLSFEPAKVESETAIGAALWMQGHAIVHLGNGDGVRLPESYAQAFLPISRNGEIVGTLEIHINQSRSSGALAGAFRIIAFVTAILLIIAMSFLGAIIFRRRKEQMRSETALNRARCYDKLTGLPNRDQYIAKTKSLINSSDGEKDCVVTMCLDIDDFKKLNDTLGFNVGNRVLVHAAKVFHGLCARK